MGTVIGQRVGALVVSLVVAFSLAGFTSDTASGTRGPHEEMPSARAPVDASAPAGARLGTRSLAHVLAANGHGFDSNPRDFDVFFKVVRAVLAVKPHSAVSMLWRGRQRLTAFLPTDGAFRRMARVVTGHRYVRERRLFKKLWSLGDPRTGEPMDAFMLFHLVPGATFTARQLRTAAPARLRTAQGGFLWIRVRDRGLVVHDRLRVSPNARVISGLRNLNKGNRQIAHGIDWVQHPPG